MYPSHDSLMFLLGLATGLLVSGILGLVRDFIRKDGLWHKDGWRW